MLMSGRRFLIVSCAFWTAVATALSPYLFLQFEKWGLYVAVDIAIGCTMVTLAAWLVWRLGRSQPNSLRRWGVWFCGWLGLLFVVLVMSAEAAIIGGHPIVLLMMPILGVLIVPFAVGVGLAIGEFWALLLRWSGRDPLVFD